MNKLNGKKQDDKGQKYVQTRLLKDIKEGQKALQCVLLSLGESLAPTGGPVPPDKEVTRITYCAPDCTKVIVTTTTYFEFEFQVDPDYIPSTVETPQCRLPTSIPAAAPGQYVVSNITAETVYQQISADGTLTDWTGDVTTLDPTCSNCIEADKVKIDTYQRCLLDDINNDGSEYVPYIEYVCLFSDGSTEVIGRFDNNRTDGGYTVVGTPTDPDSIGMPANGQAGRVVLTEANQTWAPSPTVSSFTVKPIGDNTTFTDSFGNTTTMVDGQPETWAWDECFVDALPTVTGPATIITTHF